MVEVTEEIDSFTRTARLEATFVDNELVGFVEESTNNFNDVTTLFQWFVGSLVLNH